MHLRKTAITLFLFLSLHSARANELSPETIDYLHQAVESGEYEVVVLEKQKDDGVQTVVLLGETHVKSTLASRIGKSITDQFTLMGLEGIDVSGLPGLAWYIDHTHSLFGKTFKDAQKSTMHVAAPSGLSPEKDFLYHLLLRYDSTPWLFLKNIKPLIDGFRNEAFKMTCLEGGITEEMVENAIAKANPDDLSTFSTFDEIVSKMRKIVYGDNPKQIVQLEYFGPRPPEFRKFSASIDNTCAAVKGCCLLLGSAALTHFAGPWVPDSVKTCVTAAALASIPVTLAYIGGILDGLLPERFRIPYSLLVREEIEQGLALARRDTLMAAHIHISLEIRPGKNIMLAIVGKRHVKGMSEFLTRHFDFHEVSLPLDIRTESSKTK